MREEKRWLRHGKIGRVIFSIFIKSEIATRKFDKTLCINFYSDFHHRKK